MTDRKSMPMPRQGGSYIRNPDGSLRPAGGPAPAPKPAPTGAVKPPVKEA